MEEIKLSAITAIEPTAQLYLGGVAVGSPIAMTEVLTTGEYLCDMPTVAAGEYLIIFIDADEKIGSGYITWDGTQEVDVLSFLEKVVRNKRKIIKTGSSWFLEVYDDDGTTVILSKRLRDILGGEIADLVAGVLAQEDASV